MSFACCLLTCLFQAKNVVPHHMLISHGHGDPEAGLGAGSVRERIRGGRGPGDRVVVIIANIKVFTLQCWHATVLGS